MSKCNGCGVELQCDNKNKSGYYPKEVDKPSYCERCFKIMHYNEVDLLSIPRDNNNIIEVVNNTKCLSVFMVDFLNINKETMGTFSMLKGDKVLVISKVDIIPRSISRNRLTDWIKTTYKVDCPVIYLSSKKNINTGFIDKLSKAYDLIFLLGYSNAGKSTFLNKLLDNYMSTDLKITTSMIPNTTLDFIHINLTKDLIVVDSPGFTYNQYFYNLDEASLIKRLDTKKFLSPITYQTKDVTNILIEDRFILHSDVTNSVTCYMSNQIDLVKIYNTSKYSNLITKEIDIYDNTDLIIKGVGFINIKNACKLTIMCKDFDLIEFRSSLFE